MNVTPEVMARLSALRGVIGAHNDKQVCLDEWFSLAELKAIVAAWEGPAEPTLTVEFVRQHLAEKYPAAFVALAAALRMTPECLNVELEEGNVKLVDVLGRLLTRPPAEIVGYLHSDGMRFMSTEAFNAWRVGREHQAAQYDPVVRL